jgi:type I restriction enzyme S subunit
MNPDFFRLLLNSPFVEAEFDRIKIGGGTHTNKLNLGDLYTVALPLPPLAEQHRLVAKVDELMALCDQLEAARQERESRRDRLAAASLARLNAPDPETFQSDAHFTLNALPALTTRPNQIKQLRQTILNLALRGKLVPQDLNDEPASELLKRIAREKARLVKAREVRKPKPSEPISDDDLPIQLPAHWAWARLCEIGSLSGGMTPSMNRSDFWDGEIVWLSPKDIKSDEVADSELKISALGLAETRLELYRPGCLFIVARSGILKRTLPVAINRVPAAANQDMKVLAPFLEGQERYLQIMFRGLTGFLLRELVKTGTTVQSLKYAEFEQQPFPLPPLAEQHRIVAKVDELMALCDRLEASLTTSNQTRTRLLEATLAEALAPASVSEIEVVK